MPQTVRKCKGPPGCKPTWTTKTTTTATGEPHPTAPRPLAYDTRTQARREEFGRRRDAGRLADSDLRILEHYLDAQELSGA